MKFYASAPRGMSELLVEELRLHGAQKIQTGGGAGATFEGTLETAYRLCLWGRVLNRVFLPITTIRAATPEQLYDEVKAIRWERHMKSSGTLAVDCTVVESDISHSKYAALKVKDAIVDRFRDQFGERPSVDTEMPDLRVSLQLRGDSGRISLDLSGHSLHRRGYRTEGALAPLKENLAAAILQFAGWKEIAARGGPLIDPMCGSGTFLIEGALIAADIAPGLYRDYFGFLYWKGHDEEVWQQLLDEARQRRDEGLKKLPPILGFDQDPGALSAARGNIARAQLSDYITVEERAVEALQPLPDSPHGLLVVNPPYGERLGELNELKPLYAKIGERLQSALPGWKAALFTGNPELAAYVGLRSDKLLTLFNGPLECKLFRYTVPEESAQGELINPALADSSGAQMFANRLRKNLKSLGKWAEREGIDCFRLYDADLPEYAVAVDLYRGDKVWVHVQEYEAPKTIDPDKAMGRLQEALAVIPRVLEIPVSQLFYKVRKKQKGLSQYEKQGIAGRYHEVREGSVRLLVNFTDYLDTGLFLDHRTTRQMIEQMAQGKRFLNLFAYTGVATLHAAAGGARATTTVDLSKTYLDWAQRNMALNGFTGDEHDFIQDDVLAWLEDAAKLRSRQYDLIFLDPPTFSNSKRMEGDFEVQRDHVWLIRTSMKLLAPGGTLIFSNNFRRFKLDGEALSDLQIEEISRKTLSRDFERNPHIHRCWLIR